MENTKLEVRVNQKAGKIDFNFEEMKEGLKETMAQYTDIVVTEETTAIAKQDLAGLRKLKTALNDRRIEIKNEYAKPYEAFKDKVDELIALIDEPIVLIDQQVKEFREKEKEEKREKIKEIYEEVIGDKKEYLPLEKIYNTKWENKGTTLKSIKEEIEKGVESVNLAVVTIKGMNSEVVDQALEQYKEDLSLSNAVAYINKYENMKAEIKAKEEAKRKAEEEAAKEREKERELQRAREEERKRLEEIEKVKEEERRKIEEEKREKEEAERKELEKATKEAEERKLSTLPTIEGEVVLEEPSVQLPSIEEETSEDNKSVFTIYGENADFNKVEAYVRFLELKYERS